MAAPKLTVSGLTKKFGELLALDNISLAIEDGEFISIVGPSGCGKTTFLRIVSGLDTATSGEVRIDSEVVKGPGIDRGFVFQSDNLLPWRTVLANALVGPEVSGTVNAESRGRTVDLLKLVGLGGFENYFPRQLSGGMRQRVNLARALAIDPKVLLMDEPFAALDVQTRARMQDFLLDVWRDSGASVLFVTHHIDEAVALADRVVVFTARPGRIKTIVPIDLPRPRNLFSREVEALRIQLTDLLRDEVDRAFAEQEALGATA